ncbi:MAG: hypothetical protein HY996_12055 [Micrococcales bacterium]|nr:hypothetical protein [Micrococcales bacterium]
MTIPAPSPHRGRRRAVATELGGIGAALSVALLVLAHLADSPRASLLFTDGDSMQLALVASSLRIGQPQEWAFSAVLFLPELAVYLPVAAVVGDPRAALAVAGTLNWLACYAAYRAVAGGLRMGREHAVLAATVATAVLGAMALAESSADRNALEPASLLMTTTYYSATVVATLGAVACALRMLDVGRLHRRRQVVGASAVLCALVAVAVLSNPIALAWTVIPLAATTVLALLARLPRHRAVLIAAVLASGAAMGLLGRIPFATWITEDGGGKIRPDRAAASAMYYLGLAQQRLVTAPGALELVLVVLLLVTGGVLLPRAIRSRRPGEVVLAGMAVLAPLAVLAGAVLLGTAAARYLQPGAFLPPLAVLGALAVAVRLPRPPRVRVPPRRAVAAGVVVLALGLGTVGTASGVVAGRAVARPDPDLACVTRWVDASGQYGAGQFWTVRAPKALVADPRRLIQTDAALNGYAWLVNRADFNRRRVSFLVSSPDSPPFALPRSASDPGGVVRCGRYTITEYPAGLTLGSAHS